MEEFKGQLEFKTYSNDQLNNYWAQKKKSRTWKVTIIAIGIFIFELIALFALMAIDSKIVGVYVDKVLSQSIPWTLGVMGVFIGGEKFKDGMFARNGQYQKINTEIKRNLGNGNQRDRQSSGNSGTTID